MSQQGPASNMKCEVIVTTVDPVGDLWYAHAARPSYVECHCLSASCCVIIPRHDEANFVYSCKLYGVRLTQMTLHFGELRPGTIVFQKVSTSALTRRCVIMKWSYIEAFFFFEMPLDILKLRSHRNCFFEQVTLFSWHVFPHSEMRFSQFLQC